MRKLILLVLFMSGCVTMTAGECKKQCDSKGMKMKGIVSTPTTAMRWAHDECMCVPK